MVAPMMLGLHVMMMTLMLVGAPEPPANKSLPTSEPPASKSLPAASEPPASKTLPAASEPPPAKTMPAAPEPPASKTLPTAPAVRRPPCARTIEELAMGLGWSPMQAYYYREWVDEYQRSKAEVTSQKNAAFRDEPPKIAIVAVLSF